MEHNIIYKGGAVVKHQRRLILLFKSNIIIDEQCYASLPLTHACVKLGGARAQLEEYSILKIHMYIMKIHNMIESVTL